MNYLPVISIIFKSHKKALIIFLMIIMQQGLLGQKPAKPVLPLYIEKGKLVYTPELIAYGEQGSIELDLRNIKGHFIIRHISARYGMLMQGAIGSESQIAERIAHWERRRPTGHAL
jgi:hypothetical protein